MEKILESSAGTIEKTAETKTETAGEALQLTLTAEKLIFCKKERIHFSVTATSTSYLTIIYSMADRSIVQLYPNDKQKELKLEAGKTYRLPNNDSGLSIEVAEPFGKETIIAYAQQKPPESIDNLTKTPSGFYLYNGTAERYHETFSVKNPASVQSSLRIETFSIQEHEK